jgi:ribonuclease Z
MKQASFRLTILGVSAALPISGRFTSSQVLSVGSKSYLIDCGEGAQMRMLEFGINSSSIGQVFISHLHGDHIYGLIGLLGSMALLGRKKPLDVFAPAGLEEIIQVQLKYVGPVPYSLAFHAIDQSAHKLIYEDKAVEIYSLPLIHRVPAAGFLFREKERLRNMRPEQIAAHAIPYQSIPAIKAGADYQTEGGNLIPNEALTLAPLPPRSYAYCSDTAYSEALPPLIQGVDLLYHESTFCDGMEELATATGHSTARQAATVALKAQAGQLVLGHYSSRYPDLNLFLEQAREVFPRTALGIDGGAFALPLPQ